MGKESDGENEAEKEYNNFYENLSTEYENLRKENKLDHENMVRYIGAASIMFRFHHATHAGIKNLNIDKHLVKKDKKIVKDCFIAYNYLKDQYVIKMLDLICEMDLQSLDYRILVPIRTYGKELCQFFNELLQIYISWNQKLDGNLDKTEIEIARKLIIQSYKDLIQIYTFYQKFFKSYPEVIKITKTVHLMNPKDNFGAMIKTEDELNELILKFKQQECVRDEIFVEEKKQKLEITSESARFLNDLVKREQAFRKEKEELRSARKKQTEQISIKPVSNKKNSNQNQVKKPEVAQALISAASPYLDHGSLLISKHHYPEAITSFETARKKAEIENDIFSQLRALDGLSITHAHILVKELSSINSILQVRLNSVTP